MGGDQSFLYLTIYISVCVIRLTKTKIEYLRQYAEASGHDQFSAGYWSYCKLPPKQAMMTFKEQFLEEMAVKFAGSVLAYSGVEDNGKVASV